MLCALAFIMIFSLGGFTGLMLGMAPADYQYHDTYFVVSHFHYIMGISAIYAILGAIYFWLPKWCGRMYDEKLAQIHIWVSVIAVNVTFFPQHFLGRQGMPRRYMDYPEAFAVWNWVSSLGALISFASFLFFFGIVFYSLRYGARVTEPQYWGPQPDPTLEWTLPNPPPAHTFEILPTPDMWDRKGAH
jgi:cytochrome c oxidase subunit I